MSANQEACEKDSNSMQRHLLKTLSYVIVATRSAIFGTCSHSYLLQLFPNKNIG